jgi:hypothetical protein
MYSVVLSLSYLEYLPGGKVDSEGLRVLLRGEDDCTRQVLTAAAFPIPLLNSGSCQSLEKSTDLAEWLERLTATAVVATVMGSIPASSDTVESEGQQMKQCRISYIKNNFKKENLGEEETES